MSELLDALEHAERSSRFPGTAPDLHGFEAYRNRRLRRQRLTAAAVALLVAVAAIVVAVQAFRPSESHVPLAPGLPALRWMRDIKGVYDGLTGVAADVSGVYVTGSRSRPLPGQARRGMFVRKYDVDGNEVWTRQFGGNAGAIAVDATGIYVSGGRFVRKLDPNGIELWRYAIPEAPTGYTFGLDPLAVDATGVYVAVCGSVRKLDTDGNELWVADEPCGGGADLALDALGLYVVTLSGSRSEHNVTLHGYSLNGERLWSTPVARDHGDGIWDFAHLATDGGGLELLASSASCATSVSKRQPGCLLRYDRSGTLVGSAAVSEEYDFIAGDLFASPGGLIVAGQSADGTNTIVGFLAPDGAISRTVVLKGNRWPSAISIDGRQVYVAGLGVDDRSRSGFIARFETPKDSR